MSTSRRAKVLAAIREIRAFFALGKQIPPKQAHKQVYDQHVIDAEAKRRGVNAETIRQARQFADAEVGYTGKELSDLCRLIRQVQCEQDEALGILGRTHVIRLLTVKPKSRRRALQREAIEKGWGANELVVQIAARYGTRNHGGRRRRIPREPTELLAQIERMCEAWRRWHQQLSLLLGDAKEKKEILVPQLKGEINDLSAAMLRLQQRVVKELRARQPGRAVRRVFQDRAVDKAVEE